MDVNGDPLFANNTDYSVRARVKRSAGLTAGTLSHQRLQPHDGPDSAPAWRSTRDAGHHGLSGIHRRSFRAADLAAFRSDRCAFTPTACPRLPANHFSWTTSRYFSPTRAQNASLVRASGTEEPEAYDGVSGIMNIAENNGQGLRAAFTLRNNLYFVKERSMYVTATDGVNEPALWQVEEVSNQVGTPSAHGVGIGEEWVVIAGRSGLYYFDGSEPMKLSQEIQPTWDAINWQYGQNLWVQVDTQHKRILRRRADGLGHAAESDSDARLHRGLRRPAGRHAQRARTLAKMGAVE